jgi:micrococcal nuclease
MGILRLLFRVFSSGRPSEPRKDSRANYERPSDQSQIQTTTTIWLGEVTTAQPTVSTVAGPCWVIDGDTITIDRITNRLFGIDAPELDHPYGQKSKWALLSLCKGQVVRAVFDGSLSHDRSVATCYLPDGRDLSAEMVKSGMALDWPKYSGGKYRQFEHPGLRRILWRADARQKGRNPPPSKSWAG